jgi:hypothetical protein
MFSTIGIWQTMAAVICAGLLIPGYTPCWSVIWRGIWALESEEIIEHLYEMQENSRGWLANLIETMPHADLIRVLVTMWAIWYARRETIHENIFQNPLSTHSFINKYIAELQAAKPA